jgi:hypothetical protein
MPGPGQRISPFILIFQTVQNGILGARGGGGPKTLPPPGRGSRVSSVVNPAISAIASSVPVIVFANWQQEDPAKPRSLAISTPAISDTDCALDNCRKVLDHSRRTAPSVALIRMIGESAFFNRATPFVRRDEGFEPRCFKPHSFGPHSFESYHDEMMFERESPSCYSGLPFTGIHAELFETDDFIEPTLTSQAGLWKKHW